MVTLGSDFEAKAQRAFAEAIHDAVVDDPDNLAFRFRQQIAANFRRYASRHGYDLADVIDSLRVTEVSRTQTGVSLTIEGDHPIGLFEFGASAHVIEPVNAEALHWVDETTGEDVFATRVEHPGLPEARAFRDAIHSLRASVQRRDASGRFV